MRANQSVCLLLAVCGLSCGLDRPPASEQVTIDQDLLLVVGGDPVCLESPNGDLAGLCAETEDLRRCDAARCANTPATQGQDNPDRTLPEHSVVLSPFKMDRTEVTNWQYRECYNEGRCPAPLDCITALPMQGLVKGCRFERAQDRNLPVVAVGWEGAKAYCQFKGKRLPTEAEWERAAVGPRTVGQAPRIYPWGNAQWSSDKAALEFGASCSTTAAPQEVSNSARTAGASKEGVLDLAGNVREWVEDDFYSTLHCSEPCNLDRPDGTCSAVDKPQEVNSCGGVGRPNCRLSPELQAGGVLVNPVAVGTEGQSRTKVVRGGAVCGTPLGRVGHLCDINARARMPLDKDFGASGSSQVATALGAEAQFTGFRCVEDIPGAVAVVPDGGVVGSSSGNASSGAASSGVASSGAASSGAASSGAASSGAASSGAASSGAASSGAASSGAASSGAASSGTASSGTASSGAASSGTAPSGVVSSSAAPSSQGGVSSSAAVLGSSSSN